MNFKKIVALAAVSAVLTTSTVQAGGLAEPLMAPEVIAEETNNSGGFIIPLLLLALIVAAVSSSGGGGGDIGPS